MRAPERIAPVVIDEAVLRLIRAHPGIAPEELFALSIGESTGGSYEAVLESIRRLRSRGEIESKDRRLWTDCECWGRVRSKPPGISEVSGIMTNEKEQQEEQGVPMIGDFGETIPMEIPQDVDDDRYDVEYNGAYAAQDPDGEWKVHISLIWEGDPSEIVLSAAGAKALSGGIALANSYIMKESVKGRFKRSRPKGTE